jgi:ribosomal protein S18 acetylase RimI-like enzyme
VATIALRARITSRALPIIPVEWLFMRALGIFRAFYALTALSLVDYHISNNEIYISDVAVRQTHRRRGIANALLMHAVSEAQRLAIGSLCLFVSATNPAAIALYQRNGFDIIGMRQSVFGLLILGNSRWHLMRKLIPRTIPAPFLSSTERVTTPSQIIE